MNISSPFSLSSHFTPPSNSSSWFSEIYDELSRKAWSPQPPSCEVDYLFKSCVKHKWYIWIGIQNINGINQNISCHFMFLLARFYLNRELYDDWHDDYNASMELKWCLWTFQKPTKLLPSLFSNIFTKRFDDFHCHILDPGIPRDTRITDLEKM